MDTSEPLVGDRLLASHVALADTLRIYPKFNEP